MTAIQLSPHCVAAPPERVVVSGADGHATDEGAAPQDLQDVLHTISHK